MSHSFYDLRIGIHVPGSRFSSKMENHHVKPYSSFHESFRSFYSKFVPQRTAGTRRRRRFLIFNIRDVYLNGPLGKLRSALGSVGLCFSYICPKQRKTSSSAAEWETQMCHTQKRKGHLHYLIQPGKLVQVPIYPSADGEGGEQEEHQHVQGTHYWR